MKTTLRKVTGLRANASAPAVVAALADDLRALHTDYARLYLTEVETAHLLHDWNRAHEIRAARSDTRDSIREIETLYDHLRRHMDPKAPTAKEIEEALRSNRESVVSRLWAKAETVRGVR